MARKEWILIAVLLAWAVCSTSLLAYYYFQYEAARRRGVVVVVDLYIDYGNGTVEAHRGLALTWPNSTVYDALREVASVQGEVYPNGILVTCINGVCNNATANKYWFYYVNGELAPVACDLYVLESGDVVSWNYTSPPW